MKRSKVQARAGRSVQLRVKSEAEGEALRRAWADPQVRAFVCIIGYLLPFGSAARARILRFVAESVEEAQEGE